MEVKEKESGKSRKRRSKEDGSPKRSRSRRRRRSSDLSAVPPPLVSPERGARRAASKQEQEQDGGSDGGGAGAKAGFSDVGDGRGNVPLPMFDANGWLRPGFVPPPPPEEDDEPENAVTLSPMRLPQLMDAAVPPVVAPSAAATIAPAAPLIEKVSRATRERREAAPMTGAAMERAREQPRAAPMTGAAEMRAREQRAAMTGAAMERQQQQLAQQQQQASGGRGTSLPGATGAALARMGLIAGPEVPKGSIFEGRNSRGLPMRPGAPMCSFYMRTGQCAYGFQCKWDHPEKNAFLAAEATQAAAAAAGGFLALR